MNDRNPGSRQSQQQSQTSRPNTGAGSRQQEQQTAGGAMRNEDTEDAPQMEQGGTYQPAGDRGVEFESDRGSGFAMDDRPVQQSGVERQQESYGRDRQPQRDDSEQRRQAEQQEGSGRQQGESDREDR